jgi:CSLREA domain-containing protein
MKTTRKTLLELFAMLTLLAALTSACNLPSLCPTSALRVTKTDDTNDGFCTEQDCSLREAVIASNSCPQTQTIQIPAGTYKLTLTGANEDAAKTGDLDLADSVAIEGEGMAILDGNAADRIFEIQPGKAVSISGLTLQNGQTPLFGSAIANQGNLTMEHVILQDNHQTDKTGNGGTIFTYDLGSSLEITNSAVVNNWAAIDAAGLYNVAGTLTLTNVTISGNHGYGVANLQGGQTQIKFSTLADDFGAYEIWNPGIGGAVEIGNSIIAGRTTEGNCFQPVTSDGYNLDSAANGTTDTCGFSGSNDLTNTDPRLLPLTDNGGGTLTRALDPASPAVNSADPVFCSGTDQRDVARPQGAQCDRGAFELQNPPAPATQTPLPTKTRPPEMTPTPLAPLNVHSAVQFTLNASANCRQGPGTRYNRVSALEKGVAVDVAGQNDAKTWVLVKLPASGETCWVALSLGDLSGSLYGIPTFTTPPVPETPTDFKDSSTCSPDGHNVTLSWTLMSSATGYNLYRGGKLLATVNVLSSSYQDNPPRNKSFIYEIEAFNSYGVSGRAATTVQACQ